MALCRCARQSDLPALKQIWRECFGDPAPVIDSFFEDLFSEENMVVAEEGGRAVSMAALLPCTLVLGPAEYPISYLYAMSTLPQMQGRGLGQQLLAFAEGYCKSRGDAGIALLPAEKSLMDFYAGAGYVPAFSMEPQTENYIRYPLDYSNHSRKLQTLYEGNPSPVLGNTVGVFLKLHPMIDFLAFMADPMP